jgi:hypothetical protein
LNASAQTLSLQNALARLEYNPASHSLRLLDRRDDSVVLDDLTWWTASPSSNRVTASLGPFRPFSPFSPSASHNQFCLTRHCPDGLEERLSVSLADHASFLEFKFAIVNRGTNDLRIKTFGIRGRAFNGFDFPDFRTLDGQSSGGPSRVSDADRRDSDNNLLATFGLPGHPKHSLVIGGLRYREFTRRCEIQKTPGCLVFEVSAEDPYGKLVKAGASCDLTDTVYLDILTDNRFEALESYGRALARANDVHLAVRCFPVINLWYSQEPRFGHGPFKNNTPGAVWTVQDAKQTGFLKYGPIGVRLEPDDYSSPDNQQGWWDDEHFQRYRSGQFLAPYETAAKWGAAMKALGGVPFIYCQTARRSEDYCRQFPGHLLFNDPARLRPKPIEWFNDKFWSYDFTDPGFILHMRRVYSNLRRAGLAGTKFDYPTTGWDSSGGFEDAAATTGSAYRNIFKLAADGLGPGAEVHERMGAAGDLTLGSVTTMRIQEDTDKLYPPMVTKAGLRWYKNRVAVHYDLDAKNPDHAVPTDSVDGLRAMFTMIAVVSGRLELGKYLGSMSSEQRQVISRVVPLYLGPKSARPVDAFSGSAHPQVYDLEVRPGWHQLTFYNTSMAGESWPTDWQAIIHPLQGRLLPASLSVELGRATDEGGLGLDPARQYHVFDFWNDRYVGLLRGSDTLTQQLRAGEARMMSLHEAVPHPQFLSTDRHVLQGVVGLVRCEWQAGPKKLVGVSRLVAEEPCTVIIAANGCRPKSVSAGTGQISWLPRPESPDLLALRLLSHSGGIVEWQLAFE